MKSPRLASGALGQPGQWNALHDDAAGSGTLLAHQQLGYYTLGTNPSNAQVIDFIINSTTITLTAATSISGASAGSFLIAGTAAATLQNALNLLENPWTTNSNQVALTLANQELLSYAGFALSGTTLTAYSLNTNTQPALTSYSGSTTFTSGSYTAQTMQLYVEPGTYYIGSSQVKFVGGSTPTVTAPSSHPRIDVLTINTSGTLAWTTGTENASPAVPTYPLGKVPICELYNVVGETALYDLANEQSGEGYIQADVRPFNSFLAGSYAPTSNNSGTASATGTQTIAHSLGRTPQLLRIYATVASSTNIASNSIGVYNGTTQYCIILNTSTNASVVYVENSAASATAIATATWDATNFYLAWTNASAFTVTYVWEIE